MGGFVFQMVGASFLSEGGGHPMGGIGFGVGGVLKKIVRWGAPPQLWETLLVVSLFYFALLFLLVYITSC